jgi:hypothetical protein
MYGNLQVSPISILSSDQSNPTILSTSNMVLRGLSVGEVIDLNIWSIIVVIFSESGAIAKKYQLILLLQFKNQLQHLLGRDKIADVSPS